MKKIFIAAHYNLNNGDRAVLEATIQQLIKKNEKSIVVSAFEPEQLKDIRFKTVCWPIKSKIKKKIFNVLVKLKLTFLFKYIYKILVDKEYLKEIKESEIVLISGGHHLTDILGESTFFSLAFQYLVPLYMKKPIYLLPQSIGPIDENKKNELDIVKYILNNSNYIAYRDESSKTLLNKIVLSKNYEYVPDIVYSLECNEKIIKNDKKIGIALYCNYVETKKELFNNVISNLIETINYLIYHGYKISIIPMETKTSAANDRIIANKIIDSVDNKIRNNICIEEPKDDSIMSTVSLFANKDFILAYKTHSVVFSLINHTPVVAIGYHPKSIEFMQAIGLKEYSILDKDATCKNLINIISNISNNSKDIIKKEIEGVQNNVEIIENYLNQILDSQ